MRILFLSSWYPFPADTGGKIRILSLLRHLAGRHVVTFLSFSRSGAVTTERLSALRLYAEVLEPIVLPQTHTGIRRLLPNPRWHSQEMRSSIQEAMRREQYDVVLAAEVLAGYYAAEIPRITRILDNCELTVLIENWTGDPQPVRRLIKRIGCRKKQRFTASLIRSFDYCTVVSDQERRHLLDLGGLPNRILVAPNGVDTQANTPLPESRKECSLVYPGALTFHANLDAMEFFVRSVLPLIRQRHHQTVLYISGSTDGVNMQGLPHGQQVGVELTGNLPDVRSLIRRSAVCIVPLRIGGGTRIKVLQAMALGTPVVSTSKGAEGLQVAAGSEIVIADTPELLAAAVCELFENRSLHKSIADNARRAVVSRYDWNICLRSVDEILARFST